MSGFKTTKPKKRESLWKGPLESGITYSLLTRFAVCPERFRLRVVEGLKEDEGFRHALHYGSMWHEAEEAHAAGDKDWRSRIWNYANKLKEEYPTSEKDIDKWATICSIQFPHYINYWRTHDLTRKRKPLIEEKAYRIPYILPSGRTVTIRGKIDCVFLLPSKKGGSIYIQENKTKGEIDEQALQQTVSQNLQTMIYHIALRSLATSITELEAGTKDKNPKVKSFSEKSMRIINHIQEYDTSYKAFFDAVQSGAKIAGTLYNVIRRPLSDRFAIRQGKKETFKAFMTRVGSSIKAKPDHFFKRWLVTLSSREIVQFEQQCFIPLMERLCDWWHSIKDDPFNPWTITVDTGGSNPDGSWISDTIPNINHYRFPFGVYNSLTGGFRGEFFEYLTTGRRTSLVEIDNLFPELGDE